MAAFMPTVTSYGSTEVFPSSNNGVWPVTLPSYVNEPWADTLPYAVRLAATETFRERQLRITRERSRIAIFLMKLLLPAPLPERLYDRERRVGRAIESRYRVMLC